MTALLMRLAAWVVLVSIPLLAQATDGPSPSTPSAQPSPGCGKALPAGLEAGKTSTRHLQSGDSDRTYLLHLPTNYKPDAPTPVVLSFHGFGSNPEQQNAITAFAPLSDREGFILVTPVKGRRNLPRMVVQISPPG